VGSQPNVLISEKPSVPVGAPVSLFCPCAKSHLLRAVDVAHGMGVGGNNLQTVRWMDSPLGVNFGVSNEIPIR
jgi:hypothetical protein